MFLFTYDLSQLIPAFIPAEYQLIYLASLSVVLLFLIAFGLPRLVHFIFVNLPKKFFDFIYRYLLLAFANLSKKYLWLEKLTLKLQRTYCKLRKIPFFELNSLEDGIAYIRHQEDYRKLNSLPVTWLYDRIHGDLLIDAAETLRKLSVIPDINGDYKCEVSFAKEQAKSKKNTRFDYASRKSSETKKKKTSTKEGKTPWQVLEIPAGSSKAAIKKAYRAKMKQYHPDMLAHLGPDLQKVALEKTRAIQLAYEGLAKNA